MDLIPINDVDFAGKTVKAVDARTLHGLLGSKKAFSTWMKKKVLDSPFFAENQDYIFYDQLVVKSGKGRPRKDYALTINTGKKVAMAEQTVIGDKYRDYFLVCEELL